MDRNTVLKAGVLAYFDSLYAGLIPCRVVSVRRDPEFGTILVQFVVTAERKGYQRGDIVTQPYQWMVPRGAVVKRAHRYSVLPYTFELTKTD